MSSIEKNRFTLDFLVAGFSKCGTTSLCDLLSQHPDVCISREKEPYFFCADDFDNNWDWYLELFSHAKDDQLHGEGSTYYSNIDHEEFSRKNLFELYPELKIIFIIRNPFDRLESSYKEMHHRGPEFGFDAHFGIGNILQQKSNMLDDTRYWSRLKNYLDFFPKNQIQVIFLEDLKSKPESVTRECLSFLEIDSSIALEYTQLNSGAEKLYDSKVLRRLRRFKLVRRCLNLLPANWYNSILKAILLRKSFDTTIQWNSESRAYVVSELGSEVKMILAYLGKPPNYWGEEWL
jgi:hypothetical protein